MIAAVAQPRTVPSPPLYPSQPSQSPSLPPPQTLAVVRRRHCGVDLRHVVYAGTEGIHPMGLCRLPATGAKGVVSGDVQCCLRLERVHRNKPHDVEEVVVDLPIFKSEPGDAVRPS